MFRIIQEISIQLEGGQRHSKRAKHFQSVFASVSRLAGIKAFNANLQAPNHKVQAIKRQLGAFELAPIKRRTTYRQRSGQPVRSAAVVLQPPQLDA